MNRAELPVPPLPLPTKAKGLGWPAFVLALVTAGALAHVAVRLHGLQLAYDLARQRKVQGALEEQRRRLQTEIGMLKDPQRIVTLARDRLQMGPPLPEDIRHLRPGVSLRPTPLPEEGTPGGAGAAGRLGSKSGAAGAKPGAAKGTPAIPAKAGAPKVGAASSGNPTSPPALPAVAAVKPLAAKPVVAKPEAAKPVVAKPEAAKPEAAKPVVAKPEGETAE